MIDEVTGAQATSRRTRTLVALLLLLLVLGLAADHWQRERERTALLAAVRSGEQVVQASNGSLLALARYAGPLLTAADIPPAARGAALDTLAGEAARWQPEVAAEGAAAAAVPIAPWHRQLRTARDAYAARLDRWADELSRARRTPQLLLEPEPDVRLARQRAATALLEGGVRAGPVRALLGTGLPADGEAGPAARR